MDKKFIDGIWFSVQYLVLQHDQPTMAIDLVKESGLSRKDCVNAQKRSGYRMKDMMKFIDDELLEKL